jgi:hypothetical protein
MLTERDHERSKQAIKCACLLYILQDELDSFHCQHRLKMWKNELLKEVDTEIEHIYGAKDGLCTDGQIQYTEITNKINEMLILPKNSKEKMAVLVRLISLEAVRLDGLANSECYRVHPKIKNLLIKLYIELPFTDNVKEHVTKGIYSSNSALNFFLGTYSEQVQAIKEYKEQIKEHDTTSILQQ